MRLLILVAALLCVVPGHAQVRPMPPQEPTSRPPAPVRPGTPTQPRQPATVQPRLAPALGPNTTDHGVRIAPLEIPRGAVAVPSGQPVSGRSVPVTFTGLPPDTVVQVLAENDTREFRRTVSYPPRSPRCIGTTWPHRDPVTARTDAAGSVTISLSIFHNTPAGAPAGADADGPCAARLVLTFRGPLDREPRMIAVQSDPYDLPQFVRYTYDNTAALARFFRFQAKGRPGHTCTGTSVGPASFPVGPITVDGDLALRIRSGPLGTTCDFVSMGAPVTKELTLKTAEWEIVSEGTKCCAGNRCQMAVHFYPGFIPQLPDGNDGATYQIEHPKTAEEFGLRFGVRPPTFTADQRLIGFGHLFMSCKPTLVNDHGVTVILKSATFEGPPGLEMP